MGNATSHQQVSDPASPSSPSTSHISGVRGRSASLSSAFPSSPIKAILSHRSAHSASQHGNPDGAGPSSGSSRAHTPEELIDGGHFTPQGLYAIKGPVAWDYNHRIVRDCIVEKRLAPFYRGLEEYEEEWEEDEVIEGLREVRLAQIAQARNQRAEEAAAAPTAAGQAVAGTTATATLSSSLAATTSSGGGGAGGKHGKGREIASSSGVEEWPIGGVLMPTSGRIVDRERREARAYQGAAECPICFLYYPPNINTTRCCQQPLCTECFVQIKRAEATVTHQDSEPACCPYCMEPDLGVIYEVARIARPEVLASSPMSEDGVVDPRGNGETLRRKSVNAKSKDVVTTDQIRPDWEEKVNAVKAAAARRASRRIIMHRVGDRLIPVGYTSSRNAAAAGADGESGPITMPLDDGSIEAMMSSRGGGRRGRRNAEQAGHVPGANELEELMIMEAMRLSMIEHDDQLRKAEEERKKEAEKSRLSRLSFGFRSHNRDHSDPPSRGEPSSASAQGEGTPPQLSAPRFTDPSFPDFGVSATTTSALAEAASTPVIGPVQPSVPEARRPNAGDLIDLNSMTTVPQLKDFTRDGAAQT